MKSVDTSFAQPNIIRKEINNRDLRLLTGDEISWAVTFLNVFEFFLYL